MELFAALNTELETLFLEGAARVGRLPQPQQVRLLNMPVVVMHIQFDRLHYGWRYESAAPNYGWNVPSPP